jgi:hypothetical protein
VWVLIGSRSSRRFGAPGSDAVGEVERGGSSSCGEQLSGPKKEARLFCRCCCSVGPRLHLVVCATRELLRRAATVTGRPVRRHHGYRHGRRRVGPTVSTFWGATVCSLSRVRPGCPRMSGNAPSGACSARRRTLAVADVAKGCRAAPFVETPDSASTVLPAPRKRRWRRWGLWTAFWTKLHVHSGNIVHR